MPVSMRGSLKSIVRKYLKDTVDFYPSLAGMVKKNQEKFLSCLISYDYITESRHHPEGSLLRGKFGKKTINEKHYWHWMILAKMGRGADSLWVRIKKKPHNILFLLKILGFRMDDRFEKHQQCYWLDHYCHFQLRRMESLIHGSVNAYNQKNSLATNLNLRAIYETIAHTFYCISRLEKHLEENDAKAFHSLLWKLNAQSGTWMSKDEFDIPDYFLDPESVFLGRPSMILDSLTAKGTSKWCGVSVYGKLLHINDSLRFYEKYASSHRGLSGFKGLGLSFSDGGRFYKFSSERCHPNALGASFEFLDSANSWGIAKQKTRQMSFERAYFYFLMHALLDLFLFWDKFLKKVEKEYPKLINALCKKNNFPNQIHSSTVDILCEWSEELRKEGRAFAQERSIGHSSRLARASKDVEVETGERRGRWHHLKMAAKYFKVLLNPFSVASPKDPAKIDYEGEFKDGKPHGQGTATYPDGGKYVGEYKDGKYHGQGTETWPDGSEYVGEFKDGKRHGQGTETWLDGQKYVGEWKDGKYHGQGTYTWPDGKKYVGEHKDDKKHGQGTMTYPDGDKYAGEWKDDERHGQGTDTWPDGSEYVGEYKGGKKHGQGTETYPSGQKYAGEWKDDKRHGQGTNTWPDGQKYVGEFKDGKRHGQGTETYPNGQKYVGEFKDDERHGQGTNTWPDGGKYVGELKDGKRHGQGTMTSSDGTKYIGEWKDGKYHGQGTMTDACGEKHVGEWKDGLPNGQGTYTWPNGDKYVGEYKGGKKHGQGTMTESDGTKYVGEWKDDEYIAETKQSSLKRRR